MKTLSIFLFLYLMSSAQVQSFKESQLNYARVRAADQRLSSTIDLILKSNSIGTSPFDLYLRAFKEEGELELWSRKKGEVKFQLMKTYLICAKSGAVGPKRKQGDKQVPEGFYHIDRFNPMSTYHLSLGVNYPNASDLIRSDKARPGGDIFIHGKCVTIGCLPLTDDIIEELYLLCVEAKDRGSMNIPVTFFPNRMSPENYSRLLNDMEQTEETTELWSSLKTAYDYFNTEHRLPSLRFESDGSHHVGG